MSPRLLRIHPDGSRSWLTPPSRAVASDNAPLWVVVPAEAVLLLETARVAGPESKLSQALPFLIEEQLAVPVETQHVAWAALPDPGRLAVAVVARSSMEAWLADVRQDGLEPAVMLPESLLLPWREGEASVLEEGGRALLRLGPTRAFCGSVAEVGELLAMQQAVERRTVVDRDPDATAHAGIQPSGRAPRALDVYAGEVQAGPRPLLNLLQGPFAPRSVRAGVRRAHALAVAGVFAVIVVGFAHVAIERAQLAGQAQAQRDEMSALYRQLVPDAPAPASPEAFLASALQAAGQAEAPLLTLLGGLGPVMAELSCCRLHALEFRNRSLEVVLTAPDVAALDEMRARLAAGGVAAELTAATPGSQGVEGRLRLGADAP